MKKVLKLGGTNRTTDLPLSRYVLNQTRKGHFWNLIFDPRKVSVRTEWSLLLHENWLLSIHCKLSVINHLSAICLSAVPQPKW